MSYPPDWPRCPRCGDFALDGHITCGRFECDEHGTRRQHDAHVRAQRLSLIVRDTPRNVVHALRWWKQRRQ